MRIQWWFALVVVASACEETTPAAQSDTAADTAGDAAADTAADSTADSAADSATDAVDGGADATVADGDGAVADGEADSVTDGTGDAAPDGATDAASDTWSPPDGWTAGQMCSESDGLCADGQFCYFWPCKKCGAKPQGQCLPNLPAGGCYDGQQCGGASCVGADPAVAKPGLCLPVPPAGQCWPDASALLPDCLPGSTCSGADVCPAKGGCAASQAGVCSAAPQHAGQVWLWARNGGLVLPGEQVTVTWVNYTSASIFLAGCSTYHIETRKNGAPWKDIGPAVVCVWEGNAIEVKAGGYFNTHVWTAPGDMDGSEYRLVGTWASGCQSGQPLSKAQCTATATATSATLSVGVPP